MIRYIICVFFLLVPVIVFSQNERKDVKVYSKKLDKEKYCFYEADSIMLMIADKLCKPYGEIFFSKGLLTGKSFVDVTGIDSCMSNKDAIEFGFEMPKLFKKFSGRFFGVRQIKQIKKDFAENYYLEIWVDYCIYFHQDYLFEVSFDKNPLLNKDAKIIAVKFTGNPI